MKPKILIIDDEKNSREGLKRFLTPSHEVDLAESAETGLEFLESGSYDMVLVDLRMPGMDGISFIRKATSRADAPLIVLLTAYGTMQIADEAMNSGAYDYLAKPIDLGNLQMVIDRGLETRRLRRENQRLKGELDRKRGLGSVIGKSAAMQAVFDVIQQVAGARSTVLLTGESGTGKEVVAQAIHHMSPRARHPFVAVHCAALNPNLLESELFGHEKGAYTGASDRQIGRFEKADGGTLFLDEVGELDASTQIKLLRVLESRTFERVGGSTPIEIDVRLLAATNRGLKTLVEKGRFREDLYYRLNVVNVWLPPLREREGDTALLLEYFLHIFAEENGRKINGFSQEALKILTSYQWPGNVRELRNCVERMVVMARGTTLTLGDVPSDIRNAAAHPELSSFAGNLDINAQERDLIVRALKQCNGNRSQAAEKLGISRRTLYRKLDTYGI